MEKEREKEYCIMGCGRWTGNYKDTPIDQRKNYIEGGGDPCEECAKMLDQASKEARRQGINSAYVG